MHESWHCLSSQKQRDSVLEGRWKCRLLSVPPEANPNQKRLRSLPPDALSVCYSCSGDTRERAQQSLGFLVEFIGKFECRSVGCIKPSPSFPVFQIFQAVAIQPASVSLTRVFHN